MSSSCDNSPTYKITFLDTKQTVPSCEECVELSKIMGKGHEDKYSVEVLTN